MKPTPEFPQNGWHDVSVWSSSGCILLVFFIFITPHLHVLLYSSHFCRLHLTCPFPHATNMQAGRQAGRQFRNPDRRGKNLHSQDGRYALLGGIQPRKKGSALPRSTEREFCSSYQGQGTCQKIGFTRPRATNLRVPRRRFQCTFKPDFQRVSSGKRDFFWNEKLS